MAKLEKVWSRADGIQRDVVRFLMDSCGEEFTPAEMAENMYLDEIKKSTNNLYDDVDKNWYVNSELRDASRDIESAMMESGRPYEWLAENVSDNAAFTALVVSVAPPVCLVAGPYMAYKCLYDKFYRSVRIKKRRGKYSLSCDIAQKAKDIVKSPNSRR